VGGPLQAALAELGADLGANVDLHQLVCHPGHAGQQHVGVLVLEELVGKLGSGHPGPLGHRVCLLRRSLDRPTIMSPAVAEAHPTPRPSYTTLPDATLAR